MIKTVVDLDLVGSSAITKSLEEALGVSASRQLTEQVQGFVDQGLNAVKAARDRCVVRETGDGAKLIFNKPSEAHQFADAVHEASRQHNNGKTEWMGVRLFRIGAATGEVVLTPKAKGGFAVDGLPAIRSVRLEGKAKPGELLVDAATYDGLYQTQKRRYAAQESVTGKRDEVFGARRCPMNLEATQFAALLPGAEGNKAASLLQVIEDRSISVKYFNGKWHRLPWNLPELSSNETQNALKSANVRSWKQLHTLARELQCVFHGIYLQLTLGDPSRNGQRRFEVQGIYESHESTSFLRFQTNIRLLPKPIRSCKCIQALSKLPLFLPGIKRSFSFEPSTREFTEGVHVLGRVYVWFSDLVIWAEGIVDQYLSKSHYVK